MSITVHSVIVLTLPEEDWQAEAPSRKTRVRRRWQFTAPAVLLLLSEGPSYGYQLLRRLKPMFPKNAAPPDAGGVYRLLRDLEGDGLLDSSWSENPGAGPTRRIYELTDAGRATLDGCLSSIAFEMEAMSGLLSAYYGGATDGQISEPIDEPVDDASS